jgi:hypothetical protein
MDLIYIDQSAKELRLNLVDGQLDKAPLSVLITDKNILGSIDIEAGIIGASHYISFKFGNKNIFNEVFACIELPNSGDKCFVGKVFNRTEPIKYFTKGVFSYEFTSEVLDWNTGTQQKYTLFENEVEKSSNDKRKIGLTYIFPSTENDKFKAKTEVNVYEVNGAIVVETLHAYPNEDKCVFTKSTVKSTVRSIR